MKEKRDIFIGGAWPYANYDLHVGHLAALLPGDILAKYYRGNGDNVIYISGSDCHGTPITERAKKEHKNPRDIASFYHNEFVKIFNAMDFNYDLYSNTMDNYHKKFVMDNFKKIIENGYIKEKSEKQDFCDNCNKFLSDREIVGKCPVCGGISTGDQCEQCGISLDSNLVLDKHCKDCGSEITLRKNNHLYFELPKFKDSLQKLINDNKSKWRNNAIGEAQKYIDMGLVERAATRQIDWGVDVPVKGYEDKRIYVWIEAVLGYLSAGSSVANSRGIDFNKLMSDDNNKLITYYIHGKDNIPFHTTIYPALLKSLNENFRLPDYIVSSAYVNINDQKMSKSKGNLISVKELLTMFDSDTLRLYFSYMGPEVHDINCSLEEIENVHNKVLVGMLGNFVHRNLSFIVNKFDGVIKESSIEDQNIEFTRKCYKLIGKYLERAEIKRAVRVILDYISYANKYYDSKKPWIQVKEDLDEFNKTTYNCVYLMANMSNLIAPILPNASKKIKAMLNLSDFKWSEELISGDYLVNNEQILYERVKLSHKDVKEKQVTKQK